MHLQIYDCDLEPEEHDVGVTLIHKSPYMAFGSGEYGMIDGSARERTVFGEGEI